MNLNENIKKLKLNTYVWECPKCGEEIGPALTEKKVKKLAEEHLDEEHGGADK